MSMISWSEVARAVIDSGVTQPQLARLLQCGQSTLSDLLSGATREPRAGVGLALLRLALERTGRDFAGSRAWPVMAEASNALAEAAYARAQHETADGPSAGAHANAEGAPTIPNTAQEVRDAA